MKSLFFLLLLVIVSCKTADLPSITVTGIAKEAKAGAIIIADDGVVHYLDGMDSWTKEYLDKKVTVSGWLEVVYVPKNESVEQRQSVSGIQKIIRKPRVVFEKSSPDCTNIDIIINSPEFDKHFQISKTKSDSLTVYFHNYGDMDATTLCNNIKAFGKTISFAKADFEVKLNDHPKGEVINPRIVVWKEDKKYRFFNTGTNVTFDASVTNGKVKVLGAGAF